MIEMKNKMVETCECKSLSYEEFKDQFNKIKLVFDSNNHCPICLYSHFRKMANYLFMKMIREEFTCEGMEYLMKDFITFTVVSFERLKETHQWKINELNEKNNI